jgi:MFS family permease
VVLSFVRAERTRRRSSAPTSRLIWAAYISGFVAGLDATSQFFVFPAIRDQLADGDASSASWILTVSGIVGAAILLQAGRLADRFGHDRVLVSGAVIFCFFTAVAAAAPTLQVLILARAFQSAGLAAVGVSSIAVIVRDTPTGRLATALGTWGFWTSLAGVLGPVLAATLVDVASWRLLFVAELPFLIGLVVLAWPGWSRPHTAAPASRIDYLGIALAVGGLALIVLALLKGNAWGWGSGSTLGSLAAGVVGVAFVVLRSRGHEDPVIPVHLFSSRAYDLSLVIGLAANIAFFGMWLAGLQFMTEVWGYSVLHAGMLLTIMPATMTFTSVRAGRVVDRRGFRSVMTFGAAVFFLAWSALAIGAGEEPNLWLLVPALVSSGFAMGTVLSPNNAAGTRTLSVRHVGTGTALLQTVQRIGGGLGSALVIALLEAGEPGELEAHRRTLWLIALCAGVVAVLSTLMTPDRTALPGNSDHRPVPARPSRLWPPDSEL